MDDDMQLQALNDRIAKMEQERAVKTAQLQKCAKETKGFKIAGITTLAATGIGIAVNINLHNKLNKMSGGDRNEESHALTCEEEKSLFCDKSSKSYNKNACLAYEACTCGKTPPDQCDNPDCDPCI